MEDRKKKMMRNLIDTGNQKTIKLIFDQELFIISK